MTKQIEVWYDKTSNPDEPAWCVSLCDDDRGEIECLELCDDREDAIDAGRGAAQKRGLGLHERSEYGSLTEIESPGTIQMQSMLLGHGERFAGNNAEDEAEDWIDHNFDAEAASYWCQIGVWNAATAAEFRDAGLTPEQITVASKSLTEGLDDPTEEYTDGDPIYAACNGDISTSVIIKATHG